MNVSERNKFVGHFLRAAKGVDTAFDMDEHFRAMRDVATSWHISVPVKKEAFGHIGHVWDKTNFNIYRSIERYSDRQIALLSFMSSLYDHDKLYEEAWPSFVCISAKYRGYLNLPPLDYLKERAVLSDANVVLLVQMGLSMEDDPCRFYIKAN